MEEYIKLEEEKSRRNGKLASQAALLCEPTVSPLNDNEIDFKISFNESDDKDYMPMVSYFDDLDYLKDFENEFPAIIYNDALTFKSDFLTEPTMCPQHVDEFNLKDKTSLSEYDKEEQNGKLVSKNGYGVLDMALPPRDQRHQYLRFEGLGYTDVDIKDFEERLGRIYGMLRDKVFGDVVLDLDIVGALQFQLGGVRRRISWREFILGMGLYTAKEIEDFLGTTPSYTLIRDLMLRLCHRLIAYSIAGRSQAPEKVTVTDLFYLRGMDVGLVNIPYLLARYLRMFASGRKRGAMISGGQFVVEDALVIEEGAPAVPAAIQAPQPPPVAGPARTMAQRIARLEDDFHRMRGALGEQREVLDNMACDFSRFTTWTITELSRMIDQAGVRYTSYSDYHIPHVRHTRRRTDDASTSAP
ncbi:hypothetical protein Tco_1539617 [Tanacetum coccineum]